MKGFDVSKYRKQISEEIQYEIERQGMSGLRTDRGQFVNTKPYVHQLLVLLLYYYIS